jgi:hypothetical protein
MLSGLRYPLDFRSGKEYTMSMTKFTKLLLVVLCFLALPTTAVAPTTAAATDVTNVPVMQQDLAIAAQYWGVTLSPYTVKVEPLVTEPNLYAVAQADEPGNWQRIAPAFWEANDNVEGLRIICVMVVHEYGHSTGHPHVTDPNNVMYPVLVESSVPGCNAAFPSLQDALQTQFNAEVQGEVRLEIAEASKRRHAAKRHHRRHQTRHHR